MLKLNELKPLLNLPQSRLHQPSGCDLGALALWCQIWKFSLPLKTNKNTKTNFLSSHALRCLLLCLSDNELLTVSKTLWERDIILIKKKSLHAGHVWYNYFFPFLSPFGLEMDFWRLSAWHPYFWFTASWLFWVQNNRKSTTPEPSSLESLLPLLTALSYYELQPPFVNALKAFLVKDSRMGYNFIWQILQSIN